ncbi:metal-dependent hydrolase [Candidatus Halobonum tyrrellensis]|uniref:Membrane-bound metal-dependent hydrolase n=1 Tax=Candidatus Halobonum tyrrellensis G22 TaxID=1324957 RepID=V4GXW1_9EURY|nr:metal-dependent hydrolase [Candidatus Halobonum tyrrellensis]ESP90001.1 hypothetical protein K933_00522 [Candidatus Halobonum tyrrellensis G22]
MMPWGHLAVGYLVYTVGSRVWYRRTPSGVGTLVVAFGTQFPDLVDKPLNWWFGVYDGRAVGHSLVTVVPLCVVVALAARRYGRSELAGAFSVGALTHLLGDSYGSLLSGEFGRVGFLLWPFLPAPTYPADSLLYHLERWEGQFRYLSSLSPTDLLTSGFGFQLVLAAVLFGVWALDGFPGVGTLWRLATRRRTADRRSE